MLTDRQQQLIDLYLDRYPQLAEIAERCNAEPSAYRELGNAMAMLPYPQEVSGADAWQIGKIGFDA